LTDALHSTRFNGRRSVSLRYTQTNKMREIVHLQAGQCGNQIGAKVCSLFLSSAALYLFQLIKYIFWYTFERFCVFRQQFSV